MTDLFKLVEKFIVHNSLGKDEVQKHLYLLDFYLDADLPKSFEATLRSAKKSQLKTLFRNVGFHHSEFYFAVKYSTYLTQYETKGENLQQLIDKFQVFYLVQMAEYICLAITESISYNVSFNLKLIDELLAQLSKQQYENIPSIQIYYQVLLFLTMNPKASLEKLMYLFEEHSSIFTSDEQRILYRHILNYCVTKINNGKQQYYMTLFELYQMGLQKKILYDNNEIPASTYKNIVTTGLRLGKFEAIGQFIEKYKDKIIADYPKDVYHYNFAHLLFYEAKYDKSIELLNTIEYNDVFYKIDVRKLLIKIYYERGDYLLLDSSMNAFRVFIHRNTVVSSHHKTSNQNFINFLYKIIRLGPDDLGRVDEIKQEIGETPTLAERKWLTEKLDALS